jgi:hypothetical protein
MIFITLFILEILCKPRLDKLEGGKTILWYGIKSRKYIILF